MDKEKVAYLKGSQSFVVYQNRETFSAVAGSVNSYVKSSIQKTASFSYAKWFDSSKNSEPENICKLLNSNNIAPAILMTIAKLIVGNGIYLFEEKIENGKLSTIMVDYPEVYAELKRLDIDEIMHRCAHDLVYFGNAFAEFIPQRDKQLIGKVFHQDSTNARLGRMDREGRIKHIFLCSNWRNPKYYPDKPNESNVIALETWREKEMLETVDTHKSILGERFALHIKQYSPGFPYYAIPAWYGSAKWIELANKIPSWHISGMDNGYNVRYFIEINEEALLRNTKESEREAIKHKIQTELDKCLSGAENVGKAFMMFQNTYAHENQGVVRITPINTDIKDNAFLQVFEQSTRSTISGMAIHPNLCGVETQGKLSSGSEMRIAYELWLRTHAVRPRKILLQIMKVISNYNGWDKKYPNLEFGFKNTDLTTLDENPTGAQSTIIN